MKKITLLTISILMAGTIFAQKQAKDTEPRFKSASTNTDISILKTHKLRRAVGGTSEWYNYVNIADAIVADPANLNTFVSLMNYDSSLVRISSAGVSSHVGSHSIGTIIDPTDPDWGEMQNPFEIMNQHCKITFDSLQFRYLYVRTADSMMVNGIKEKIIDTIFIQYFLYPQMRYYGFGAAPNSELALIPDSLNAATGLAANYAKMDTILIDENDSTLVGDNGFFQKNMRVFVGLQNNQPDGDYRLYTRTWKDQPSWEKSVVGFNILFKSMKPTVMGDTMYAADGSTISNKHNFFGYNYAVDQNPRSSQLINTGHLNGSFRNLKSLRYGQTNPQGWRHYIPGRAFFERQYQNAFAKLTTLHNVSVKDINNNGYGVAQIYPNPTSGAAYLEVSLKKSNQVNINILNISGQVVYSNAIKTTAGKSIIKFNTENLVQGIYLATISVDGNTFTRKFIVE